ncbi:endo-1,4-beta-xylanase [Algoriphagus mannitolivorans]|uniref:endo-1,4-beta-xylanase n=1 Tax=Algoriphagus mannitolivorans TaxID=226504 RepID=UPI00042041F4|nr:endo-1,4-beta-xylanase [Algoriphagus mannitolivorans]
MKKIILCFLIFGLFSANSLNPSLGMKEVFRDDFRIGTAVNLAQVTGREKGGDSLLSLHFNSLTPENGLKWALVQPQEGRFDFAFGDAFVQKGQEIQAFLVGHTLVWHQQTPKWVFEDLEGKPASAELLRSRMEQHIQEVVGRFQGKIHAWDVVNEAFEDNGTWRQTPWRRILGPDYIEMAFRKAHEVDPKAKLLYNDYNVWKPEKLEAILAMIRTLQSKGVKIHGVGMQGHYRLDTPSIDQIENAILKIHELGLEVHFTELDIDVLPRPTDQEGADLSLNFAQSPEWNPFPQGLPKDMEEKLVRRYVELFQLFRNHADKIERVTFWGLSDQTSWLNNWPVRGRTNYPLLFDRSKNLKPGFMDKF